MTKERRTKFRKRKTKKVGTTTDLFDELESETSEQGIDIENRLSEDELKKISQSYSVATAVITIRKDAPSHEAESSPQAANKTPTLDTKDLNIDNPGDFEKVEKTTNGRQTHTSKSKESVAPDKSQESTSIRLEKRLNEDNKSLRGLAFDPNIKISSER